MLPKLVLLASVLLGVGLSHATAHFCGMPMTGSSLSHSSMHGPAPERAGTAHHAAASQTAAPQQEGTSGANPFVLCLTAVAAVLAAAVLGLILVGRPPAGVAFGRERPARLPAVRGSPPPFALSLRRVTVLRV